jgi:hypothetical protein
MEVIHEGKHEIVPLQLVQMQQYATIFIKIKEISKIS